MKYLANGLLFEASPYREFFCSDPLCKCTCVSHRVLSILYMTTLPLKKLNIVTAPRYASPLFHMLSTLHFNLSPSSKSRRKSQPRSPRFQKPFLLTSAYEPAPDDPSYSAAAHATWELYPGKILRATTDRHNTTFSPSDGYLDKIRQTDV